MNVTETIDETRRLVAAARKSGKTIGIVPTMGALHAGHASLIDAARKACDFVAVSIFVNPIQFGPSEDLSRYPRTPQADLEACRRCGADAVFMPSAEVMYPPGRRLTEVRVLRLPDTLCGRTRHGHFTGVCTVVSKLFNIVQPDKAFFGAKDYQQATIIRRMVADLDFPIEIVICPIVREADGLAMSSRNVYLTPQHRRQAVALSGSLRMAEGLIRRDRPPAEAVIRAMREYLSAQAPDGAVEYIQIVDPDDLTDVLDTSRPVCLALAVKFGGTRLIDNMMVDGGPAPA